MAPARIIMLIALTVAMNYVDTLIGKRIKVIA